ncbi:MAG: ABC transporter substrate-binding protein [Syntrophobacterales bacterium]|nr:ABC transporter substrate-binding protein [Syntrophobacterales bacterium]
MRQGGRHGWLLGLAAVLLLAGAGSGKAAVQELALGEINPLTGALAKHGLEIHQGIALAVEEVNARGGLAGRRVKLLSRDDQSRPEIALNQAQDLITRERVVGLVGGYVDTLVGPISEMAAKHQVPYVASASLQAALTRKRHNPYFFRISNLEGILSPVCRLVGEVLRPQQVALIYMATPGSLEFAEGVEERLTRQGIRIPVKEKFRPGAPDFSMALLKVRMTGCEVLISGGFYPDNLLLTRQLREQRLQLQALLAPWGAAYPSFIAELGELSEGVLGTCAWTPGVTWPGTEKDSQAFITAFEARFQQSPTTTAMHGYASARVLLTALERALARSPAPTGEQVVKELRTLDLTLPLGRVRFDAHGDPLDYHHVVVQIQGGRLVPVYPPERAQARVMVPLPAGRK